MTEQQFLWDPPPLAPDDERLIEAYRAIGKPLDDLPYTEEFERLRERVAAADTNESRHFLFRRLLRLRKTGRLPRLSLVAE
jgi:hypothetical protein